MGRSRKSKRWLTVDERDEFLAQLEREQALVLEELVKAQGQVERWKAVYQQNRLAVERIRAMPVFEYPEAKQRIGVRRP